MIQQGPPPPQTFESWAIAHLEQTPDFAKGMIATIVLLIILYVAYRKISAFFSHKSSD